MDAQHRLVAPADLRNAGAGSAAAAAPLRLIAAVERGELARCLGYLGVTRLALLIIGACALRLLPAAVHPPAEIAVRWLAPASWVRWDAWWYLNVAERGYWFDPQGPSNVAFFPLFPLLVRAAGAVTGNLIVAGLVVANVAAVAAVVALWRWTRAELGPAPAERAVRWLLVFPFGFILHTVYAESLYFALVALAFLARRRDRWVWAGICGGLAAATRPLGVLLFPAFAWAWWQARRDGQGGRPGDALALLLIPAGLAAYAGYLWAAFGTPLAFWDAHAVGWNVRAHWDPIGYWRDVLALLLRGPRGGSYTQLLDTLRVLLPLLLAGLTVVVFRRLGGAAGLYTAAVVAVAVVFAPESVGREALAAVPAFAAAGAVDNGGGLAEALRLLSFGCLVVLLIAFQTAHFVG